ncbi:hypothetical protein SDC9_61697 [bioreactor metagenome]|uniref:Uncharacterized protein n=1 Tax=bioreactor metagenome TaxID=1076179 RepID=A0A644XGU4_9ZZZZ
MGVERGSTALAGKNAFHFRSGRSHHKIARQVADAAEHPLGVAFPRRVAGNDHRAGLNVTRMNAGLFILVFYDLRDFFHIKLGIGQEWCKIDRASVYNLLIHDFGVGHLPVSAHIHDVDMAEQHHCRGSSDINSHTEYFGIHVCFHFP